MKVERSMKWDAEGKQDRGIKVKEREDVCGEQFSRFAITSPHAELTLLFWALHAG